MKNYLSQVFLLTALIVFLSTTAQGSEFADRMDRVHQGMGAHAALTILGRPRDATKGPGGSICLNYFDEDGAWVVTIYQGRVIRIDRP